MSEVTLEQVKKIASLAKILFTGPELEKITEGLNGILHWTDKIQSIETEGITPLINPNESAMALLEDIAVTENLQQDVLKNAPKEKYGYFVVPKVIE